MTTFSAVISSKDRPEDIKKLLDSITMQTRMPAQVIVVEAGHYDQALAARLQQETRYQGLYEHFFGSSLTQANNRGVAKTSGEIVFFLDDDIVLEKDFFAEILKVFTEKGSRAGGVIGNITNTDRTKKLGKKINIFYTLFLLNRYSEHGKFTAAGFGTYVHGLDHVARTEFLSGGITAYRREALQETGGWDDRIPKYGACCDEDMSYRISRKYLNFYTPFARCTHKVSETSRQGYTSFKAMTLRHRAYLFKKNFARSPFSWLKFYWAILGLYLLAIYSRDWAELKGYIQGTWAILQRRIP